MITKGEQFAKLGRESIEAANRLVSENAIKQDEISKLQREAGRPMEEARAKRILDAVMSRCLEISKKGEQSLRNDGFQFRYEAMTLTYKDYNGGFSGLRHGESPDPKKLEICARLVYDTLVADGMNPIICLRYGQPGVDEAYVPTIYFIEARWGKHEV